MCARARACVRAFVRACVRVCVCVCVCVPTRARVIRFFFKLWLVGRGMSECCCIHTYTTCPDLLNVMILLLLLMYNVAS